MKILTIKTDQENAQLCVIGDEQKCREWFAHKNLSNTILEEINKLCEISEIEGIVAYKGPGSFTGLRIGLTVGNALAYGLKIPIVSESSNQWKEQGLKRLKDGDNEKITIPNYGSEANITKPKK